MALFKIPNHRQYLPAQQERLIKLTVEHTNNKLHEIHYKERGKKKCTDTKRCPEIDGIGKEIAKQFSTKHLFV